MIHPVRRIETLLESNYVRRPLFAIGGLVGIIAGTKIVENQPITGNIVVDGVIGIGVGTCGALGLVGAGMQHSTIYAREEQAALDQYNSQQAALQDVVAGEGYSEEMQAMLDAYYDEIDVPPPEDLYLDLPPGN